MSVSSVQTVTFAPNVPLSDRAEKRRSIRLADTAVVDEMAKIQKELESSVTELSKSAKVVQDQAKRIVALEAQNVQLTAEITLLKSQKREQELAFRQLQQSHQTLVQDYNNQNHSQRAQVQELHRMLKNLHDKPLVMPDVGGYSPTSKRIVGEQVLAEHEDFKNTLRPFIDKVNLIAAAIPSSAPINIKK